MRKLFLHSTQKKNPFVLSEQNAHHKTILIFTKRKLSHEGPGRQLTQSAAGLEQCGQSPQEVQGCAGIQGALQRELLHQSIIYRHSPNLVLPSWNVDGAPVISWDGWRAAPVPPLAPGAPCPEEEEEEQREVTPGAGAVIHREPAELMPSLTPGSQGHQHRPLVLQRVRAVLRTHRKCLLFYLEPAEVWP